MCNNHLCLCLARIFQGLRARRRSLLPTIGTYQADDFEPISYPWSFRHPRDGRVESMYGAESPTIILAFVSLESSKGYMLAAGPCFQQSAPTKPMVLKKIGILGRMDIQETVSLNQCVGDSLKQSSWPLSSSNLPRATCSSPVLSPKRTGT